MAKNPPCPEESCRKHSALSAKHAANAATARSARERKPNPRMRAGRWKRRRVIWSPSMPW
eukprot:1603071-Prymnesium_polylepis.1